LYLLLQRAILIKAAQEVLYEGDLRLVSGPRTAVPCKVVVMNNVVLFLRTKEKDGMVAYRLLRDVCTDCELTMLTTGEW